MENENHKLVGLISLTRIIKADKKLKLNEIESPDIISIRATDDQEVAHNLFNKIL